MNLFVDANPFHLKASTGRNQCTSVHLIQSVWWISVHPLEYKEGNDNLEFLFKHLSKKTAGSIVSIVIIRQNMKKKRLKINIWKMHELSQNSAKEICAENISTNWETFKCELCDTEANSEPELQVHKAKWHENVAPYYKNITRLLAYQNFFSE